MPLTVLCEHLYVHKEQRGAHQNKKRGKCMQIYPLFLALEQVDWLGAPQQL